MTTARYDGLGIFVWVRDRLVAAGRRGVSAGQLWTEIRQNWDSLGLRYSGGTYNSFRKRFRVLLDLRWIERTEREEPALQKGERRFAASFPVELSSPRTYYRITRTGRAADQYAWSDPSRALYPQWTWAEKVRLYGQSRRRRRPVLRGRRGRPPAQPPVPMPEADIRAIQEARAERMAKAQTKLEQEQAAREEMERRSRRIELPPRLPPEEVVSPLEQRLIEARERIQAQVWKEFPEGSARLAEMTRAQKSTSSRVRQSLIDERYLREQASLLAAAEGKAAPVQPPVAPSRPIAPAPPRIAPPALPTAIPPFKLSDRPGRRAAQQLAARLRRLESLDVDTPQVDQELEQLEGELQGWVDQVEEVISREENKEELNEDRLERLQEQRDALEEAVSALGGRDVGLAIDALARAFPAGAKGR